MTWTEEKDEELMSCLMTFKPETHNRWKKISNKLSRNFGPISIEKCKKRSKVLQSKYPSLMNLKSEKSQQRNLYNFDLESEFSKINLALDSCGIHRWSEYPSAIEQRAVLRDTDTNIPYYGSTLDIFLSAFPDRKDYYSEDSDWEEDGEKEGSDWKEEGEMEGSDWEDCSSESSEEETSFQYQGESFKYPKFSPYTEVHYTQFNRDFDTFKMDEVTLELHAKKLIRDAKKAPCRYTGRPFVDPPLVRFARSGDLKMVMKLIELGVKIDESLEWTEVVEKYGYDKSWDWNGDSALVASARNGHMHVVTYLLDKGADITHRVCYEDDLYETASEAASRFGHHLIARKIESSK